MKQAFLGFLCISLATCAPQAVDTSAQNQVPARSTAPMEVPASESAGEGWKLFVDDTKSAVFHYPPDWSEDLQWHRLLFSADDQDYTFGFYDGQGLEFDSETYRRITINGQPFMRTEFMKQGHVFLVTYQPIGVWIGADGIQGEVPPGHEEYYVELFDRIMETIRIEHTLDES